MPFQRISATRFLNSLIEGGSRPALVKADDGEQYVVKLRGAAQGVAPLRSELIVGELARLLGLRVPEIALVILPENFSKEQPDPELRELLAWSAGTNVGLRFVREAIMFDPASAAAMDGDLASTVIWLDALTLNVDRTNTNPNLLQHGNDLILIDHGAALYFHFNWASFEGKSQSRFGAIQQHVLLRWVKDFDAAAQRAKSILSPDVLAGVIEAIPDDLFAADVDGPSAEVQRTLYRQFLTERVAAAEIFEQEVRRYANTL